MTKRTVAAGLWLLAAWTTGNVLTTLTDLPSVIGPAVGLLVAAFVWWDPAGWFWTKTVDRARLTRRIADLPRVSETRPDVELRREADTARG